MKVYCTMKNTFVSMGEDSVRIIYLGGSLKESEEAVGAFRIWKEKPFPENFLITYPVFPDKLDLKFIKFYGARGLWYSIVMFELEESND